MKHQRLFALILSFCLLLSLYAWPAAAAPANPLVTLAVSGEERYDLAAEVFELTSAARVAAGGKAFTYSDALSRLAMQRAAELVVSFSHIRPNGESCFDISGESIDGSAVHYRGSISSENIAAGQRSAAAALDTWMSSAKGHRENILNPAYSQLGVGCFVRDGKFFWVQLFGTGSETAPVQRTRQNRTVPVESDKTHLTPALTVLPEVRVPTASASAGGVTPAFADVRAEDYFAQPVAWAVAQGVTNGTSAATFSPNDTCTRAQIITFLYRAAGSPALKEGNSFADVPANEYYTNACLWAAENGIVSGRNFAPNTPCTRAMAVEFMWRHAGAPTAPAARFDDVPASASHAPAVAWAVAQGVTNGTSAAAFSPNDTCTRGQIVTFLYRYLAK